METLPSSPSLKALITCMQDHGTNPSKEDQALIERAYTFAEKAHAPQQRSSGEPYFNHVFAAGYNCARFGMDARVVAAGLLHDTLEDADISAAEFRKEFGEEILFLVEGVTKLGKLKYRGADRHVESLRKFFVAVAEDARVLIIKIADRLHNLSTLKHVREDKQKRIALESIEIYAALASRLGMGKLAGEIQDLAFPYAYPKEHKEVVEILKQRKKTDEKYLEKVYRSLLRELAEQGLHDVSVKYRVKGTYSLYKKLLRKNMDIAQINDIIALRVLVHKVEDCYRVLGIIHSIWKPLPGRIKDYVALPKPNGYQSLHTTIFTGDGSIAEIQIRTHEMNDIAEYGIASHHAYKQKQEHEIKQKNKKDVEEDDEPEASFDWLQELHAFQKEKLTPSEFMQRLKTDFFQDRIFIFTPHGDVIDLPKGSTVIDFAYALHSEIGHHISGAKINGKQAALKDVLKSRDIVEVIKKSSAEPSQKWLTYAQTSLAKKRIRIFLAKKNKKLVDRLK